MSCEKEDNIVNAIDRFYNRSCDREVQNLWIRRYLMPIFLDADLISPIKAYFRRRQKRKKISNEWVGRMSCREVYAEFCSGKYSGYLAHGDLKKQATLSLKKCAPLWRYIQKTAAKVHSRLEKDNPFAEDVDSTSIESILAFYGNQKKLFDKLHAELLEFKLIEFALKSLSLLENATQKQGMLYLLVPDLIEHALVRYTALVPQERRNPYLSGLAKKVFGIRD